jgi:transposase
LPGDERLVVERHLREFDRLGEDLKVIERDLARSALADEGVKRLMTIPGVDMIVALAIVATIGEVGRFEQSQKLVSYLGLNPSVRQSGPGPAYTARSPSRAPGMRAACSSRRPGRRRERRLSIHSAVQNTFNLQRHLTCRRTLRVFREEAFRTWRAATAA